MPECIKCGEPTKFDGGLCYKCYKKGDSKKEISIAVKAPQKVLSTNDAGLTDKEKNYRYNMIKGRIAETLIQELFLSLGYNVFRYGMENTIPGIMELLKGAKSEVATEIRRMPDFVIQNPNTNKVFLHPRVFNSLDNLFITKFDSRSYSS